MQHRMLVDGVDRLDILFTDTFTSDFTKSAAVKSSEACQVGEDGHPALAAASSPPPHLAASQRSS